MQGLGFALDALGMLIVPINTSGAGRLLMPLSRMRCLLCAAGTVATFNNAASPPLKSAIFFADFLACNHQKPAFGTGKGLPYGLSGKGRGPLCLQPEGLCLRQCNTASPYSKLFTKGH